MAESQDMQAAARQDVPIDPPELRAPDGLTLRRLGWLGLAGLGAFVVLLELTRHLLYPYLQSAAGHLGMDAVVICGALLFFAVFFRVIQRMQDQLVRQNQELLALHTAVLDIWGELALEVVLQKIVDRARLLFAVRYGALSLLDEDGRIRAFITSGLSVEERERIAGPPCGAGLLGVSLQSGRPLRIADLRHDPRAAGFPAHHPALRSLLAVPVRGKSPFRGNLYLADKLRGEFCELDEDILLRFAAKAAIAIDNAHMHQRLRSLAVAEERMRIAHELHDGMAQVLAYVNTKAQAVKEFLHAGRAEEADAQLDQLAEAAREVLTDAREGILGLRAPIGPDHHLTELLRTYLDHWQDQFGLDGELRADDDVPLPPAAEMQLARIAQEALANVRKHARARHVVVELRREGPAVALTVADDGVGFVLSKTQSGAGPRFGLLTMRERAQSAGGELEIDSTPGAGTRIRVVVPLEVATQIVLEAAR